MEFVDRLLRRNIQETSVPETDLSLVEKEVLAILKLSRQATMPEVWNVMIGRRDNVTRRTGIEQSVILPNELIDLVVSLRERGFVELVDDDRYPEMKFNRLTSLGNNTVR